MVKVSDVLEIACDILDLEEVYAFVLDNTINDLKAEKEAKLLLKCFNLVYSELMTEYVPLKHKEKVFIRNNGVLNVGLLSKDLYKVIRVLDRFNNSVPFEVFKNEITLDYGSGECEIEYSYLDKKKNFSDLIEYENYPTKRVIAYGVVAEYLLITGVYDEASLWNSRFKQSLKNEIRRARETRIKARRYL